MDVEVTQQTSGVTPVTAAGQSGLITTVSLNLAEQTAGTFTVNNPAVDANSVILVGICHYSGTTGFPTVRVNNMVAGQSFDIVVLNVHGGAPLNGTLKIGFLLQ
jgi:hypothetical protein